MIYSQSLHAYECYKFEKITSQGYFKDTHYLVETYTIATACVLGECRTMLCEKLMTLWLVTRRVVLCEAINIQCIVSIAL